VKRGEKSRYLFFRGLLGSVLGNLESEEVDRRETAYWNIVFSLPLKRRTRLHRLTEVVGRTGGRKNGFPFVDIFASFDKVCRHSRI